MLVYDRTSNKYELNLNKCTQHTYSTIEKLLAYHDKYDLFTMNSVSLANFYEKFMARYKTTPLPKVKQPKSKQRVQIAEEEKFKTL